MTSNATQPLRIGFLPFYVDYYEPICPDFPHEKAALAARCAQQLSQYGQVVWEGNLIRDAAGAEAAGKKLAKQQVDCVVVVTTIAVFSGISIAALQNLQVPLLIWNAQQIKQVGKGYSMVEIVRNTGQIGTQALVNVLVREGRWFRVVTGYFQSKRTGADLLRFFDLVGTAIDVQNARLLDVGGCFPLMTDIMIDDSYLAKHLGPKVVHVNAEALTRTYNAVPEKDVKNHRRRLQKDHRVSQLTADEMARSIRLCEALEKLVTKHGADAGTLNCHGPNCLRNQKIGVTACYSLGMQNAAGRPFTCTGDLPTALVMLMLKRLTGTSMYTEVQVMDEKRKAIVIANSGEGEQTIRRPRCQSMVRGNMNFKGVHGRGASFAYPLKAGPATIASLTPTPKGDRPFRLIVAEGHILADRLPDAGALAGFFRFKNVDLHTGYTGWLEAGPIHHAGTTLGHWAGPLADLAELLDIEFVGVG